MSTTEHDVRGAAQQFLAAGYVPIPLPARSKGPTFKNWPHFQVTEAEIEGRFPADGNIGLLLGDRSNGLVDVDLDSPEAIRAAEILLPSTNMISGRQSAPTSHWWYSVDKPPTKAGSKFLDPTEANKDTALFLELRSTGGQTVVPPSVYPADPEKRHPNDERCVWHKHGEPAIVDTDVLQTAVRAVAAASLLGRHWPTGARHDAALALAAGLLRAGWLAEMVERFMCAVCAAANDDEVGDRLKAVHSSEERLRKNEKATGWTELMKLLATNGETIVSKVREWLRIQSAPKAAFGDSGDASARAAVWPAPIPLTVAPNVPPYPVEVLSPWLRDWAEAVALELQIPVDLPAGLGLGLLAAGIARKVVVSPRTGFTEPTNLFVMVALPPGDRKTQTFRRAIAPVQKLQRDAREAAEPAIIQAESEHRIAEKRIKHLEDKIAKAEAGERESLQEQLKTAREELAAAEVPPKPVFYTEDDTPESLKLELIRQGGRMVVASTEARCLENITLYNDKPNFDVYLKGHAGDEMNSGRVGRGRDMVTEPALSCILAPQPAVLQGLAEDEILRGRGFLARWLYALPKSRVGLRTVAAPSVPQVLLNEYERRIRAAWEIGYAQDDTGNVTPHIVQFTADAAAEFEAFERWIEPQLASGLPLARLAGWANKLNGECARIAAALHVADAPGVGQSWTVPITVGVVRRAIQLCREYLIAHAQAAFDLMGADVTLSHARRVWAWITEHKLVEFKLRDCFRAHQSVFETVDDLQPCLELLERHYLVRAREQQRAGRGRPASPVYDVNPNTDGGDDSPEADNDPPPAPTPNSVTSVISVTGCVPEIRRSNEDENHSHSNIENTNGVKNNPSSSTLVGNCSGCTPVTEMTDVTEIRPGQPETNSVTSVISVTGSGLNGEYRLVTDLVGLSDVVTAIEDGGGVIGLDTETTGLDHATDRIRLIQLATVRGTFVLDLLAIPDHTDSLSELFEVLSNAGVIGHNLGFDLPFLMRLGFIPGRVADTMLASQIIHAGDITVHHGLKDVAARVLKLTLDKAEQKADWSKPLTPEMLKYAATDAEIPVQLWAKLKAEASAAKLDKVLDVEMGALPAVAWASLNGVGFDRPAWEQLALEAEQHSDQLREQLDALDPATSLTTKLNWNSHQQVKAAFASLGIKLDSTDDDTLAGITHPLAVKLREYRSAAKLAGTYGTKWLRHISPDGRVHAGWRQIGAGATGRMSCAKPNLQQLPRDPRYRRCFVAPPGRVLVMADYSQIELRIAAKITGDERMAKAYRDGEDLHTITAKALLRREDVTKADRQLAKAVNFGLLYGQGAEGLMAYALGSFGVKLTKAEATAHRNTFFRTYPGLRAWHRKVKDRAVDTRTEAGRRRLGVVRYTEKLNTPVQGTGADGLKQALALLWERRAECPDAFPVLFVHDEIVVECDESRKVETEAWLRKAMIDGMAPLVDPIPVEVEVTCGQTWAGDVLPVRVEEHHALGFPLPGGSASD